MSENMTKKELLEKIVELVKKCEAVIADCAQHEDCTLSEDEAFKNQSQHVGKQVIIRTYSSGVHYGELIFLSGTFARVKNVRNVWSWEGALSLNDIAANGIKDGKLSTKVPGISEFTETISIFPLTRTSLEILEGIKNYEV